jgi:hypothetical protein
MRYVLLVAVAASFLHMTVRLALSGSPNKTPGIEEVVERYLDACGGRSAVEELDVIHTMDSITIAGISGVTESWWIREPFSGRTSIDLVIVRQEVLIIGDSVWSLDRNGHLTTGSQEALQEAELAKKTIFYNVFLDLTDLELGPDTIMNGTRAWPLRIGGDVPVTLYISEETWLPILSTVTAMGIQILQYPLEYTDVDGIVSAMGTRDLIPAFGQESVTKNILTEYNVPIPDSVFSITVPDADWLLAGEGTAWSFELSDGHIYMDGSVGNSPVTILLDSGAGATVIDSALASELDLEGIGEFVAQGIGGAQSVSFVEVPGYSVAGATFTGQNLAVLPLDAPFYPYTGKHIGLVLGYDFLSRFITLLDFGENTMTLWDPDSFDYTGDADYVDVTRTMSLLSLEALLEDSIPVTLLLDTGAGGNLHLTPSFFEEYPDFLGDRETYETIARGVGGLDTIRAFRIRSITFGGYRVPCGIASSFGGAPVLSQYHGIIGTGILARFRIYFDYGNSRIVLEPSGMFEEGLPEDMTGIGFETDGDRILVSHVVEGSAGDSAGALPGDVLLGVEGTRIQTGDLNSLEELIPSVEGAQFQISLLRDGEELDLIVTTKRLLPLD